MNSVRSSQIAENALVDLHGLIRAGLNRERQWLPVLISYGDQRRHGTRTVFCHAHQHLHDGKGVF